MCPPSSVLSRAKIVLFDKKLPCTWARVHGALCNSPLQVPIAVQKNIKLTLYEQVAASKGVAFSPTASSVSYRLVKEVSRSQDYLLVF
jgi:hypothetical protein